MNMRIPKYHTTYAEGPRPVFISSFVFGGKTYTGEVGQNKKVAEQLVARTAIRSLLDQHQKEENIQIAGLPFRHQGASIQTEVVSFGARPGRTANAMANGKLRQTAGIQGKKRSA